MSKTIKRTVMVVVSLGVVWALATLSAYGDDWDKATKITINQPFEVPGTILPAGTYIVKLVDLAAERHVVRFLSEDEKKVYATLIAIPDFRLEPAETTSLTFYESPAGRVRPLHAWFYPGHQFGVEFAYPERRALEIATVAEEHVIAVKEPEVVPYFREEPLYEPNVSELLEEPLFVIEPGGEEVGVAEVHPEVTVEPSPEVTPLPKTATPFPLFALVGLLAAGAASSVRLLRR
jgi:hypothetical protein